MVDARRPASGRVVVAESKGRTTSRPPRFETGSTLPLHDDPMLVPRRVEERTLAVSSRTEVGETPRAQSWIEFDLHCGEWRTEVTWTVVRAEDMVHIAGARIDVLPYKPSDGDAVVASLETDDHGQVTLVTDVGWRLRAHAPGREPAIGRFSFGCSVWCEPSSRILALAEAGRAEFHVVTPQGRPVENAKVAITWLDTTAMVPPEFSHLRRGWDRGRIPCGETDAGGTLVLDQVPAGIPLRVEASRDGEAWAMSPPFVVPRTGEPGHGVAHARVVLGQGARLLANVRFVDGPPVPTWFELVPVPRSLTRAAYGLWSDESGEVDESGVPAGRWRWAIAEDADVRFAKPPPDLELEDGSLFGPVDLWLRHERAWHGTLRLRGAEFGAGLLPLREEPIEVDGDDTTSFEIGEEGRFEIAGDELAGHWLTAACEELLWFPPVLLNAEDLEPVVIAVACRSKWSLELGCPCGDLAMPIDVVVTLDPFVQREFSIEPGTRQSLDPLPAGEFRWSATHDDHGRLQGRVVLVENEETFSEPLALETLPIRRGRIVDANGVARASASVAILRRARFAGSGASSVWEIVEELDADPAGVFSMSSFDDDLAFLVTDDEVSVASMRPVSMLRPDVIVDVPPPTLGTIRGSVVDREHRPVVGLPVAVQLQSPIESAPCRYASTDAQGRFEFADLPRCVVCVLLAPDDLEVGQRTIRLDKAVVELRPFVVDR